MAEFAMTIGIPGCGKTKWRLEKGRHYYVVSPDDIRKELTGDISDQSIHVEVWRIALGRAQAALSLGHDTLLDATNVNDKERRWFLDRIPKDCKRRAIVFHVDPDVAIGRIRKDIKDGKNRSNVPEHAVYRYYGMFLYSMKVIKREGFDTITVVD